MMKIELNTSVIDMNGTELTIYIPEEMIESVWSLVKSVDGKDISVTMSPPFRKRSVGKFSQGHHLNAHIQDICRDTGNSFADIKLLVKMMAIERGYPFTTIRGKVIPKSEADSSVEECSILIDTVHQLAAEEGICLNEGVPA